MALGHNKAASTGVLLDLLDDPEVKTYNLGFLFRKDLPEAVLDAAISHPNRAVRLFMVETGNLTAEQWERLLVTFQGDGVHGGLISMRDEFLAGRFPNRAVGVEMPPDPSTVPPSTPAEIAEWAAKVPDIEPDTMSFCPWWIGALHNDPEAMRQLAASSNLEIRRGVARARHLPPDVLDRLAHDEDRVVRLFLTESCDDTPADVLLEVWTWWDGTFSFPGRPRNHPNFPKTGLLRYAADPDPRMRLLALADVASTPELVDRFADDPDPRVRREAAGDPRLSPAALVALLLDDDSAYAAARNPGIPVPVMHRMIAAARALGC